MRNFQTINTYVIITSELQSGTECRSDSGSIIQEYTIRTGESDIPLQITIHHMTKESEETDNVTFPGAIRSEKNIYIIKFQI